MLLYFLLVSVLDVVHGQVFDCSDQLVHEFGFGVRFTAAIEDHLNQGFPDESSCEKLSSVIWLELNGFFDLGRWETTDEATRRRTARAAFHRLHFQAMKSNSSAKPDDAAHIFKSTLFAAERLFENDEEPKQRSLGPSCANTVARALQVKSPFSAQLAEYFESFNQSTCAALEVIAKSKFSQMTGLTETKWTTMSEPSKRIVIKAFFRLLYFQLDSNSLVSANRTLAGPSLQHALLGDIFEKDNTSVVSSAVRQMPKTLAPGMVAGIVNSPSDRIHYWSRLFWLLLLIAVVLSIFFGIRLLLD